MLELFIEIENTKMTTVAIRSAVASITSGWKIVKRFSVSIATASAKR